MTIDEATRAAKRYIGRVKRAKGGKAQVIDHFLPRIKVLDTGFDRRFTRQFGKVLPARKTDEAFVVITNWFIGFLWHTFPNDEETVTAEQLRQTFVQFE